MIKTNWTKKDIIRFLINHYKGNKQLTRFQIDKLLKYKDEYDFLQPDKVKYVYSGIKNISDRKLKEILNSRYSNRMIWSSDYRTSHGFYKSRTDLLKNKNHILIIGYFSDNFVLNPLKISKLSEIKGKNFTNTMKLSELIKGENEILTSKPVKIHTILHEKNS